MRVKDLLREAVAAGEYPPDSYLPGERYFASKYSVSYMTARRAIESLVSEGLFGRRSKRTMVNGNAISIATSPSLNVFYVRLNTFVDPLINGVEIAARERGWITQLILMRDANDATAVAAIESGKPGVILLPTDDLLGGRIGEALVRSNGRVVMVGNQMDDSVSWVKAADRQVMRKALDYLVDLGHRDILFLHDDILHRGLEDMLSQLRQTDLSHHPVLDHRKPLCVKVTPFESRPKAASQAVHRYLAGQKVLPTAIACANDELAVGALHALRGLGLSVPQKVSLLSFGNTALTEYAVPSITVIDLDFDQHIRLIFEALSETQAGQKNPIRQYFVQPSLLIRESTGPGPHPRDRRSPRRA